jgi:hypothetical protein
MNIVDRIVNRIISDLTDRSGLEDEWDQIDDTVQDEIRDTWKSIVVDEISKSNPHELLAL